MIGIIGAMSVEVEALKGAMTDKTPERISGIDFVRGMLCGKEVVVAQCGVGKVFAAMAAQTMILRFGVDTVINTGVAGTLTDKLGIADFAISTACVQHDMDTSAIGDPVGLISGINVIELPADRALGECVARVAGELGINSLLGVIASGDQFINNASRKAFIRDTFGAVCCEMEGAAIGQVCYVNGVDFVIIRCISDNASGEAEMEYPEMVKIAAVKSQQLVEAILERI